MDVDHELARLDALCAHIEKHGIGDLFPFLSLEEVAHIEARQSLRKYLRRNKPDQMLPIPDWVRQLDKMQRLYVYRVRKSYLNQVRAAPRGRGRQARLNDIKQRYMKEMRSILKNLEKQEIRDEGFERVYASRYRNAAPAASAIGGALFGTNMHKWMALFEADFDMWSACL